MFEWDETKRQVNIEKHGVDFRLAAGIFLGPVLEAVDDRENYAETRFRALGKDGHLHKTRRDPPFNQCMEGRTQ